MSRCIIHCFHHVQAIGKPPLNWSRTSLPSWIDEWTDEWMYLFVTLTWVKYFQPFTPFIGIAHEQRSWQALRANINNVFPSKQLPINQEHEVGDSRYQWCNPITIEPMLSASASFLYWLTTSSIIEPTITPLITARNQLYQWTHRVGTVWFLWEELHSHLSWSNSQRMKNIKMHFEFDGQACKKGGFYRPSHQKTVGAPICYLQAALPIHWGNGTSLSRLISTSRKQLLSITWIDGGACKKGGFLQAPPSIRNLRWIYLPTK